MGLDKAQIDAGTRGSGPQVGHFDSQGGVVGPINKEAVERLSRPLLVRHTARVPGGDPRTALLDGWMRLFQVQPGMYMRLLDVRDRYELLSEARLNPGLTVALVLSGHPRVAYGSEVLELGGGEAGQMTAEAVMVAMDAAEDFRRWGQSGQRERTLTLACLPEWLEGNLGVGKASDLFNGQHLSMVRWWPSPAILGLVESLFQGKVSATLSSGDQIRVEGCALALLGEALEAVEPPSVPSSLLPMPGETRALTRLRELIASGEADTLTQRELAARVGMSVSTLQRRFRSQFGTSLGHHLRQRRLSKARHALYYDGVDVEAAAALAGYSSAANFATAFKRAFGMTPSACRSPA